LPGRAAARHNPAVDCPSISDGPAASAAEDDSAGPSHEKRRRWLPAVVGLVATLAALAALVGHEPGFYRDRCGVAAGAEAAARRLVSGVAALRADIARPGPWEGAFAERELNAWLATDLARHHDHFLPAATAEPRVELLPRRVRVAARIGYGPCSAVAWGDARVVLREPNQLVVVLAAAGVGALPLPRGVVLGALRRRLDRLGMVTSVRRLDDGPAVVVYIPSTHDSGGTSHWLESLAIGAGSVALAGTTRPPGARPEPTPRAP